MEVTLRQLIALVASLAALGCFMGVSTYHAVLHLAAPRPVIWDASSVQQEQQKPLHGEQQAGQQLSQAQREKLEKWYKLRPPAPPTPPAAPREVAKLFTFHRDEVELLADWTAYHIRLVGAKNIYIIDQDSSLPVVKDTLAVLELAGVNVVRLSGEEVTHWVQGATLSRVMREAAARDGPVKLLVPLDVDEMIVAVTEGDGKAAPLFSTNPADVQAAWEALPETPDVHLFKFESFSAAICEEHVSNSSSDSADVSSGLRRAVQARHFTPRVNAGCFSKSYFLADGFSEVQDGQHHGVRQRQDKPHCNGFYACADDCFLRTAVALVHYGEREAMPYASFVDKFTRHSLLFGHKARLDAGEKSCGDAQHLVFGQHHCVVYEEWLKDPAGFRDRFYAQRTAACSGRVMDPSVALAVLAQRRALGL